jgi:hypothetical protein
MPTQRQIATHHEAGHAVVALAFFVPVRAPRYVLAGPAMVGLLRRGAGVGIDAGQVIHRISPLGAVAARVDPALDR